VPHFGEEPEIAGVRGSGAMFFAGCNLRCAYCQNAEISQGPAVRTMRPWTVREIADAMHALAARGCHNINWVTPSHVVPFAVEALALARSEGLDLPLVFNTSSYDGPETVRLLDGIVDVWLADLRYSDDEVARDLSGAEGYVAAARAAIVEMARQVGVDPVLLPDGTLGRGLVVRLLVLPNDLAGVRESLAFLKDTVGTRVRIALMSQYYPTHRADDEPLLSRRTSFGEYARVVEHADRLGFVNALIQEPEASEFYRPDFGRAEAPFADARHFSADDAEVPGRKP
jgi:putative pyruvate formate lyase activating enzyme